MPLLEDFIAKIRDKARNAYGVKLNIKVKVDQYGFVTSTADEACAELDIDIYMPQEPKGSYVNKYGDVCVPDDPTDQCGQ